jgi:hypothetical protein
MKYEELDNALSSLLNNFCLNSERRIVEPGKCGLIEPIDNILKKVFENCKRSTIKVESKKPPSYSSVYFSVWSGDTWYSVTKKYGEFVIVSKNNCIGKGGKYATVL